ncbi:phosphatase PAP2 family protein [Pseudarthrobacter sulfonivorans]|uniref:phosphatase PAP2 family protein n=1 Tax=Pseudarthrobacter sulfonivorans TaxID=121292 RepID=UPI0021030D49|nr:phosphatase PAP2 family protein [Pseudarthrobacter sulfonivorans]
MPDTVHSNNLSTARADAPQSGARNGARGGAGTRLLALPRPRLWVLWGILLAAAVVVLGVTVAVVPGISTDELAVDQNLSQHHSAPLTGVAMALNLLFGPVAGVLLIAAVALVLLLVRRAPVNAVAFGLVAVSGWVASEFFKILVARQRPDSTLLFDPLAPENGADSFPSGHVTFAVTVAFAVYFLARGTRGAKFAAIAGVVVVALVAWSRLYIGVHYPSDVVGSLLAGTAAVILVSGCWTWLAPRLWQRVPVNAVTRPFLP